MKKVVFFFLTLCLLVFTGLQSQDFPNPAVCHTVTGEPIPAFFSLAYNIDGYEDGDWFGVYNENGYCYGAMPFISGFERGQFNGYGNDPTTDKKDGFDNGEEMYLFLYDFSEKICYTLTGSYTHGIKGKVESLTYHPMDLYRVDNILKGPAITLKSDSELSQVLFNFGNLPALVNTRGVDAIKLKFIRQNASFPNFYVASGKGTVINKWDGFYYKYSPDDVNVIINAVGINNFTEEMVTAKLTFTIDKSMTANTVYEDANILFYLKGNSLYIKGKTEQVTFVLYRTDGGVEKKFYGWSQLRLGKEVEFLKSYSTFKGTAVRMQYKIKQGGSFGGVIEKQFIL